MKKTFMKLASGLFPSLITSLAYKQLTNPQVHKLRPNELITLEKAEKEWYPFNDFDIQLYRWNGGNKKVLLIHGWEGQAGNFSDLIEELVTNRYDVYSFDGPSHGASSKGNTSLLEFTELVGLLVRKFDVHNLISHSFGGVATTYALFSNQDLEIDSYALLTTPDKFSERIDDVASQVGITNKVKSRLIEKIEKEIELLELDLSVSTLNVSEFVKNVNVKRALIIHDKNDRVIPISQSKHVHENWTASEFREIEGTGHFRILRTKNIIDQVIAFIH
jgi:pimeloyl-ACP methyl ester carboxylesterase